jgi:hypothetical protein
MNRPKNSPARELNARRWGNRAAMTLQHDWVGWVQQRTADEIILADNEANVIRLVTVECDDGPHNLVLPSLQGLESVNEGRYVMCVHRTLWFSNIALRLPTTTAWDSTLFWQTPATPAVSEHTARHLALMADWLLARAPEGTFAALIPDLLVAGRLTATVAHRTDLPAASRLFLVQVAETLSFFMPALTEGNMAAVEQGATQLAGLGDGTLPAGTAFLIGMVAGLRLWEPFCEEGSGLQAAGIIHRLTRGHATATTSLGDALLRAANDHAWEARWHTLHAALTAAPGNSDDQRNYLRMLATAWLDYNPALASASLAGLLLPFLWHQHRIRTTK